MTVMLLPFPERKVVERALTPFAPDPLACTFYLGYYGGAGLGVLLKAEFPLPLEVKLKFPPVYAPENRPPS